MDPPRTRDAVPNWRRRCSLQSFVARSRRLTAGRGQRVRETQCRCKSLEQAPRHAARGPQWSCAGVRAARRARGRRAQRGESERDRQLRCAGGAARTGAARVAGAGTLPLCTRRTGRADPVVAARRRERLSRESRARPRSQRCARCRAYARWGASSCTQLDNIESVPWIGAPAVWSKIGRGEQHHASASSTPASTTRTPTSAAAASLPSTTRTIKNVVEPGTFPTAKVKGGFDFAGPTYDANDPDFRAAARCGSAGRQRPRLARRGHGRRHRRAGQRRSRVLHPPPICTRSRCSATTAAAPTSLRSRSSGRWTRTATAT